MAEAQVVGRNYSVSDRAYVDLCQDTRHWRLAIGGDSHARNISNKMRSIMGYGSFQGGVRLNIGYDQFALGGMRAMEYIRHPLFNQLRSCSARIVLLHMGGNDCDMPTGRNRGDVVLDILQLFVNLEQVGKIVYVVGIPTRHSQRHQVLTTMQDNVKYINVKLRKLLRGRFLALPPPCFPMDSFVVTARGEMVHLKDRIYKIAAEFVLDKLNKDLTGRRTPPSQIERDVNRFINTHLGRRN